MSIENSRGAFLKSLASLDRGEAWFWSPGWLGLFERISVSKRSTFDSSATPDAASHVEAPQAVAEVDLDHLKQALSESIQAAEDNDPKALKKRLADLERQLQTQDVSDQVVAEAVQQARREVDEKWRVKVRQAVVELRQHSQAMALTITELLDFADREVLSSIERKSASATTTAAKSRPPRQRSAGIAGSYIDLRDVKLSKCARLILRACYWLQGEEVTKSKVSFYSGYRAGSGGFNNALSELRKQGLIEGLEITEAGVAAVPSDVEPKPTGSQLREWLGSKLGVAEKTILDALIKHYPDRLTNEELGEASGYSAGSGGFNNALSKLRTLDAIEGYARNGGMKASDVFFNS